MQPTMKSEKAATLWRDMSATRAMASWLGVLAGLGNVGYGILEILQGNTKPTGIIVNTFGTMSGTSAHAIEPTIFLIPSFIITGILLVVVSMLFTIWSAVLVQKKNGGLVMIILSIVQFFIGGSTVRSIQGLIYGIIGTRIHSPFNWWRTRFSERSRHLLSNVWPWVFVGCVFLYIIHIGSGFIDFFIGINNPTISLILLVGPSYGNLLLFVIALVTGLAHDSLRQAAVNPKY